MKSLTDSFIILCVFLLVISILSNQIFQGELKYRCVELDTVYFNNLFKNLF